MEAAGYAETAKLIGRLDDKVHTHAIVDAPAFAYYILSSSQKAPARDETTGSEIFSLLPYAELARLAVEWLERVETFGFEV